jgi:hypothetical protein
MLSDLYGGGPSFQPDGTGVATHPVGHPEPTVRSVDPGPKSGPGSPALLIVGLLFAAILITQLAFRGTIEVEGG